VNRIITKRAPGLSVLKAKSADSATSATNATKVGGQTVEAAVVSADASGATVVRGNATGASRIGAGFYIVSFPPDIRNCTYVATNGDVGASSSANGEISVEQLSSVDDTDIEVRHFDSSGGPADYGAGDGFHIEVIC